MLKRHLNVLVSRQPSEPEFTPGTVMYSAPNPDRTRKNCENCVLWIQAMSLCAIHAGDVRVQSDFVCNYHVFGTPQQGALKLANVQPVYPEFSGLKQVVGGVSCDTCTRYQAQSTFEGECSLLDAPVDALGVCLQWESRD